MINTLLAVAALSGTSLPQRNLSEEPRPTTQTYAQELEERFNTGFAANRDNTDGWFSGRCYRLSSPNTPFANLLVTETRTSHGNNGPIFDRPLTKIFSLVYGNGYEVPADYFDNMTPAQRAQVQQFIDANFFDSNFTEAYMYGNSFTGENMRASTRWEVRSDVQYHYLRVSAMNGGASNAFCYFFKKVK